MAVGWLMVLQSVPWAEVIKNAPKLADGAKKLWNAVAGTTEQLAAAKPQPDAAPGTPSLAALEARTLALEAAVSDLHSQMIASSELIKALAEQNTQLIQRIEANRGPGSLAQRSGRRAGPCGDRRLATLVSRTRNNET